MAREPEPINGNPLPPALDAGVPASAQVRYYFLSEILGRPVRVEGESAPFGRLVDIGAAHPSHYPVAVTLEVRVRRGRTETVPWPAVTEFSPREIVVRKDRGPASAPEFLLRRDVLDDQVVDVRGAKVVRVNDVHLVHAQGSLILGHVEVGMLGILRRLGLERPVRALLRWLLDYEFTERFVTWRHVQVVAAGEISRGLRLSSGLAALAEKHPADLADIIEDLGLREGRALFKALPVETAADALEELDPEVQRAIISQEEPAKAADILEEMPAHEAAAVLRDVHDADAERIIRSMETEAAEDVREILSHEEETAGGIMATECVEARPDERAADVLARMREHADEVEVFYYIHVLDGARHLVGILNIREILRAEPDTPLREIMTTDLVTVGPEAPHREVAEILVKYGFRSVPVVDGENTFLGAVRIFAVAGELMPAARE